MYTPSSGQCWDCVRGQGLVCGMWNIYQTFPTKAYLCGHDVVCFFVHCRAIHDGVILPASSNSQFPNMDNGRQIDDIDIDKIRDSIVVSISACHAEDPGSIPGRGISSYPDACDVNFQATHICIVFQFIKNRGS